MIYNASDKRAQRQTYEEKRDIFEERPYKPRPAASYEEAAEKSHYHKTFRTFKCSNRVGVNLACAGYEICEREKNKSLLR